MNVPNASRVNSRTALITGASSGIGEAFAEVFAAHGFDLVITARREDRLRAVAARLEERYGIRVLVFVADHARQDTAERLCAELAARGLTIDALVNNAGYGVPGTFVASPWQRHQDMLQVMVVGLAELTHRLLPGMIDRGYGRIINVASLAGLVRRRQDTRCTRRRKRSSSNSRRRCRMKCASTTFMSRPCVLASRSASSTTSPARASR